MSVAAPAKEREESRVLSVSRSAPLVHRHHAAPQPDEPVASVTRAPVGTGPVRRAATAIPLDELAPGTPRMPHRGWGVLADLAASAALHATIVAVVATLVTPSQQGQDLSPTRTQRLAETPPVRIVFLAPEVRQGGGGGGGGGGNQQSEPIRRAQGVGTDPVTLRTRTTPPPAAPVAPAAAPVAEEIPQLPAVFLQARPLASGAFDQIGLPTGAFVTGTSTGPGSGGGVGTGVGSGMGSGRGPGLGPGSGGGTGGGAYRPGGAVSAPRLISQVRPQYTPDALQNQIQGTVVLEVIVTRDGRASNVRVVRSLDRGLDAEALSAVDQWRFAPGRLAGAAVDVLVTIRLDFTIH